MSHALLTPIPVLFCGIQFSTNPAIPAIELYTLLEAIPGHPLHSTVSLRTIHEAGYTPVLTTEPQP